MIGEQWIRIEEQKSEGETNNIYELALNSINIKSSPLTIRMRKPCYNLTQGYASAMPCNFNNSRGVNNYRMSQDTIK
jgi:hypothetical protein